MRITRSRVVWTAIAAALAAGVALALQPRPVPVDTAHVTRGPLVIRVTGVARTRVTERHVVSAPVPGHLLRIGLRAGDTVQAGQALARIGAAASVPVDARARSEIQARIRVASAAVREASATAEKARIGEAQAKRELERMRSLAASHAVPHSRLEDAEFEAAARARDVAVADLATERARSDVEVARAALLEGGRALAAGTAVTAPVSGRILRVLRTDEGPVAAGTPLLELGDPATLELVVELPTADAVRVRPGAAVELEHWGGGSSLAGKVRRVEPSGFTKITSLGIEEQRVNVIVDPGTEPGWQKVGDGYQMDARIVVSELQSVLRAPAGSLIRRGHDWTVFTVMAGQVAERTVETGEPGDTEVEIRSGVNEGDRLVLFPGDTVKHGVAVVSRQDTSGR